jgi:hypothetical protein
MFDVSFLSPKIIVVEMYLQLKGYKQSSFIDRFKAETCL